MKSKILAIYLPQFHAIPENDKWWGEGFTEWFNVKRGVPLYPGHYQPRQPLNDNYYDLSDIRVLEKHTRMARKAGISGFCFYHYYFNGKKLLEKPIENYRDNSKETFPYCLIWANESWKRRWYRAKMDNTILMQQDYGGEEDWKKHFYYLLDFFKDDRYIKINNKPVYIIYIPQDISCRRRMFTVWQNLAREHGFAGIFLIAMNTSFGLDNVSGLYDSYMDFEPLSLFWNDTTWRKKVLDWKSKHIDLIKTGQSSVWNLFMVKNHFSYPYLCKEIEKKFEKSKFKTFPGIFSGWDNTSRKDEEGIVVRGSNPRIFQRHVLKMLRLAEIYKKEFVFLNAWNEWSEGAYIEPDQKYGYAYLKALKNAIDAYNKDQSK